MKQTPGTSKDAADKLVRGIKRSVRRQGFSERAGAFVPEALVRFMFQLRRRRFGAASGAAEWSLS